MGAAKGLAAITQGFGDVDAGNALLAVEISKRAGDTKRPVIAPRAQAKGIGGLTEKRAPGMVRSSDTFEQASVAIGIGSCARMFQRGEALGLDRAGRSDTGANLSASLRGRRQYEVGILATNAPTTTIRTPKPSMRRSLFRDQRVGGELLIEQPRRLLGAGDGQRRWVEQAELRQHRRLGCP